MIQLAETTQLTGVFYVELIVLRKKKGKPLITMVSPCFFDHHFDHLCYADNAGSLFSCALLRSIEE